jgi:hypothetical protein
MMLKKSMMKIEKKSSHWSRKTRNGDKKSTVEFPSLKGLSPFATPNVE